MSQYPDHARKGLMGYAMRTERYRMVAWVDKKVAETGEFGPSMLVSVELYDYRTDPLESVNLFNNPEYKGVLQDLKKKWVSHFKK